MSVTLVGTPDPEPCPHKWHYIDERDLWWCSICRRVEPHDDDGGDDDGGLAA